MQGPAAGRMLTRGDAHYWQSGAGTGTLPLMAKPALSLAGQRHLRVALFQDVGWNAGQPAASMVAWTASAFGWWT